MRTLVPVAFQLGPAALLPRSASRLIVADTFSRPDSATSLGSAETGQTWLVHAGTWGIAGGQAYSVTGGVADKATIDAGRADGIFQVAVADADYSIDAPELTLRFVDTNNWLGVYLYNGAVTLAIISAGSARNVASAAIALANGQSYTLRAVARGTAVTVFVDGVQRFSYTLTGADATTFTSVSARRAGLVLGTTSASSRFDNFMVWN